MTPLAGLPLRYLIGVDDNKGVKGNVTEPGYHATKKPTQGVAAAYANCRQEEGGRRPGVEYIDPPDDIEQEYGEPAFVYGTDDFWQNLEDQCHKWLSLGFEYVEIDNLDTYNVQQSLEMLDRVAALGLSTLVKNPSFVEGDSKKLVAHPFCVMVICEQDDDVTAHSLDKLRKDAGKPDMPIRVVTYGDDRPWAQEIATGAAKMTDFGVTYSSEGEYESVEHLLKPSNMPEQPAPVSPKPWNATLEGDIGRFHDGPDVPSLATQTARVWPEDAAMAKYVTLMGNNTAWCGLYCGWKLSRWGIRPPFGSTDVARWAYVDAWKVFGTSVPPAQREDGDLALWLGNPHHISWCWKGKFLGGNQNNTVNISNFRTPDVVRRPPAPENYTPQPDQLPMLMIESSGDSVRYLQTLLNEHNAGLEVDGEFGPATEQAVKDYQTANSLEVDGIVGPETWTSLMSSTPVPKPEPPELLTDEQIEEICAMAADSSIARYSWKSRGVAPLGMTKGLAVMYAQCMLKLAANDSAVLAMTQPIGTSSKDALAYYNVQATGRDNVLRKLFVMLYGLAMRESSGNYTEGRDITASNVTAETAEAGLYQQSWNSSSASNEMKKLLPAYSDNKQPCYADIFKEGITLKSTKSYGSGTGYDFQELAKSCPAFAVEMCAVGLRVLYNHWGPIVRQESEMRAEAEALLVKVAAYIADIPAPEPPPVPDDIATAKAQCMASIETAVDRLIAQVVAATKGDA